MRRWILFFAVAIATSAQAQAPDAAWRTITTRHFRIHCTADDEEWARSVASRIESIRDAVVAEVGFAPETITDVVVANPVADPNGITYSLLDTPRIVLYTEPPGPELQIGEFSDWPSLLTVHEMTHLVHLLRPSRNRWERVLEKVVPLNPITTGAPRWVLEGYATMIEGRVTGSGRPSGSMRAAVLRTFAREGRLPTYGQLSSDRRFLGMSMAYLAGSAFLEWLEKTHGPQASRDLWARMTARQRRNFDQAFRGVFGDSPARLYGRFTAELTASAVAIDRGGKAQEGELWQETTRASGDPAVSPDGKQIALVLRDAERRATLVIESTGPNEEEAKLTERIATILRRDPQDVAPLRNRPLPRKHLFELTPIDGGDLESPRWTRDGRSILYSQRQPDREGTLHHDLFLWTPATGVNRRVTHMADVHDADPLPDGRQAVAVRARHGLTQLVLVDLETGVVTAKSDPQAAVLVSHPRASATGALAWSEHRGDGWFVAGAPSIVRDSFDPEWASDGRLFATVARAGFFDLARLTPEGAVTLVRSSTAAFQPAPSPGGSLFFMSLDPDGFVVRHLAAETSPVESIAVTTDRSLVPAIPPAPSRPTAFVSQPVVSRPYGIGRQEVSPLVGGQWTAFGSSLEAGLRVGDVVGRLETMAIGATGDRSLPRGVALASVWRGWPVAIGAHLFRADGENGAELRGGWEGVFPRVRVEASGGALALPHQRLLFFASKASASQWRRFGESLSVGVDSDHHARASLGGAVRLGSLRIAAQWTGGRNLAVGGVASSIEPDSLLIERRLDPALDRGAISGGRYRGERVELGMGVASLFWQRHDDSRIVDVMGLQLEVTRESMPILKAAAFHLTGGIARVRQDRRTRAWLALRWRP